MKINEKNLCVFATNPPYDCEGFLSKRGEGNKAFLRRFFVLKGNLLFYFEKKGDKEPLGLIIVEGCTIELSEESDQYCFEIAFNGNRTYVLCADSQESMECWMKALTCAGYEYKKLMVAELQRKLDEIEGSHNRMLAESALNSASQPRPPPRRQNPFNRPAPPLPVTNGSNTTVNNALILNGSSIRTLTANNTVQNPVPPPRTIKNEFYTAQSPQQQQNQQQPITSAKALTSTDAGVRTRKSVIFGQMPGDKNNGSTSNFTQVHEQLRQLVLKDVLEYQTQQELKARPLIDL